MSVVAEERAKNDKAQFGFWLYLMTDMMLFASLFATYMILRHSTNGGVGTHGTNIALAPGGDLALDTRPADDGQAGNIGAVLVGQLDCIIQGIKLELRNHDLVNGEGV